MTFQKTEKARLLLQSHDGTLGLRERRLLILCNGQRNQGELTMLFGEDVGPVLRQLQALGLIVAGAAAAATPAPARTAPVPAAVPAAKAPTLPPAATGPRRSLVAAKMYVLDMLQLQRGAEVVELRNQIQASREPEAMLAGFAAALHFISTHAAATLAQRVRERLLEVLPEEHLPALRQLVG